MRKIISLILIAALCLSLAACGGKTVLSSGSPQGDGSLEKAFAEAQALMDAGDYTGAIAAYSAIGYYQQIADQIAKAEDLLRQELENELYGTWMDVKNRGVLTLQAEGSTLRLDGKTYPVQYTYDGTTLHLSFPVVADLTIEDREGITHLVCPDFDLVSQEDYPTAGPQEITITMENWEEYFEIREANRIITDDSGNIVSHYVGAALFLREEYTHRVVAGDSIPVDFQVTFDWYWMDISGDYPRNFTLSPSTSFAHTYGQQMGIAVFYRNIPNEAQSDINGVYAATLFNLTVKEVSGQFTNLCCPQNIQVVAATGTLLLVP